MYSCPVIPSFIYIFQQHLKKTGPTANNCLHHIMLITSPSMNVDIKWGKPLLFS